jgi:hypothetical protein
MVVLEAAEVRVVAVVNLIRVAVLKETLEVEQDTVMMVVLPVLIRIWLVVVVVQMLLVELDRGILTVLLGLVVLANYSLPSLLMEQTHLMSHPQGATVVTSLVVEAEVTLGKEPLVVLV